MRGFLLTLDALFALALVSLALSFFAFSTFSPGSAGSAMFLSGRDYLSVPPSLAVDVERAILIKGWHVFSVSEPSRFSVHVKKYAYPRVCSGTILFDAPCLQQEDFRLAKSAKSVWVGVS